MPGLRNVFWLLFKAVQEIEMSLPSNNTDYCHALGTFPKKKTLLLKSPYTSETGFGRINADLTWKPLLCILALIVSE